MTKHLPEPLAYSPTSLARRGVGRGLTTIYKMMNSGELRYKVVGGRRIIPAEEAKRVFCELDDAPEGKAA